MVADKFKVGDLGLDDKIEIDDVLMVGTRMETKIGRPYVPDAKVNFLSWRNEAISNDK